MIFLSKMMILCCFICMVHETDVKKLTLLLSQFPKNLIASDQGVLYVHYVKQFRVDSKLMNHIKYI